MSASSARGHYANPPLEDDDDLIDPDDADLNDFDDPLATNTSRQPLSGNIGSSSSSRPLNEGYLTSRIPGEDRAAPQNTIDESVWDTLRRDLLAVWAKLREVLYPRYLLGGTMFDSEGGLRGAYSSIRGAGLSGTREELTGLASRMIDAEALLQSNMTPGLRDWDLWGPLIFCLLLSLLLSFTARGDQRDAVFSGVFAMTWVGEALVTLQIKLLGGNISFAQSVCIIGYTLFPLVLAAMMSALGLHWIARIPVYIVLISWSMAAGVSILGGSGVVKNRAGGEWAKGVVECSSTQPQLPTLTNDPTHTTCAQPDFEISTETCKATFSFSSLTATLVRFDGELRNDSPKHSPQSRSINRRLSCRHHTEPPHAMADDAPDASPKNEPVNIETKEDEETRAARRELKQSSISDPATSGVEDAANVSDAPDNDDLKEQVASPKKKRAHDQLEGGMEAEENDATSVASTDSAKDRALRTEPEKKRHRDEDTDLTSTAASSQDATKDTEAGKSSTKKSQLQTSSSAFAASGFGKLTSGTSPFASLGGSQGGSVFGSAAAAAAAAGKPSLSSFASPPSSSATQPPAAPKLTFGGSGSASPFAGLSSGTNGSPFGGSTFGSALGAGKPLSSFAAPGSEPLKNEKPAKPFGAPDSDAEDDEDEDDE
ncbi:hypothetical protein F66182_2770, partial [Fusarium sp. NRRL 66182]